MVTQVAKARYFDIPFLSMFCPIRIHKKPLDENVCEINNSLKCFIEDLKREKWHHSPEDVLLKTAFEKKIIQKNPTTINGLDKEDKENLKCVLVLCSLEELFLE